MRADSWGGGKTGKMHRLPKARCEDRNTRQPKMDWLFTAEDAEKASMESSGKNLVFVRSR